MTDHRQALGRLGEELAARFLESHGLNVVAANVGVGRGEIDLIAKDGSQRVAVEVRTVSGELADPIDAVDRPKREHVTRLSRRIGVSRVDLVGVRVGQTHVDFHWVPV